MSPYHPPPAPPLGLQFYAKGMCWWDPPFPAHLRLAHVLYYAGRIRWKLSNLPGSGRSDSVVNARGVPLAKNRSSCEYRSVEIYESFGREREDMEDVTGMLFAGAGAFLLHRRVLAAVDSSAGYRVCSIF